jgi:hypothetical protein
MIKFASELMTRDDWIRASNNAKETGGHFMSNLAHAYQHADTHNARALRENYHQHFFGYLDFNRRLDLQKKFEALALAQNSSW